MGCTPGFLARLRNYDGDASACRERDALASPAAQCQQRERDYRILENDTPCLIEEPHLRGMALHQLKKLVQFARARCEDEEWIDAAPNNLGKRVNKDAINLYHLVAEIVKPATKPRSCSYVEFASADAKHQVPNWFVSHYWGERVADFIVCIDHFNDRHLLSPLVPFWICAYALRQNPPGPEIGTGDPTHEPFARALKLDVVQGTVMILDQPLQIFSRAWCTFEGTLTLQSNKRLDLVVSQPSDEHTYARMIADGVAGGDGNPTIQEVKDQSFPLEVAERGMNISIQDATATRVEDVNRILNCIASGANRTDAPPYRHENYERYNAAIRAKFAAVVLRVAIATGAAASVRRALRAAPQVDLSYRDAKGHTYLEAARLAAASSSDQARKDIEDYLRQATEDRLPLALDGSGHSPVRDPRRASTGPRASAPKVFNHVQIPFDLRELDLVPAQQCASKLFNAGQDSSQSHHRRGNVAGKTPGLKSAGSRKQPPRNIGSTSPTSTAASAAEGFVSPSSDGGSSPTGAGPLPRGRARSTPAKKTVRSQTVEIKKTRSLTVVYNVGYDTAAELDVSGGRRRKKQVDRTFTL